MQTELIAVFFRRGRLDSRRFFRRFTIAPLRTRLALAILRYPQINRRLTLENGRGTEVNVTSPRRADSRRE
jgi:hypothetical protein